ncbi:MAG: hypothetical protein NZ866_00660 [Patescibacteria group bacterium]|nr:hypothetical protein [Patescibacteria group bacterium]
MKEGDVVTITGSTHGRGYGGGDRIGLPWAIRENDPASFRLTGREFLGNNYGCNRYWNMQVSVPLRNENDSDVFFIYALPQNLNINRRVINNAEDVYKYSANKLVSYVRIHRFN